MAFCGLLEGGQGCSSWPMSCANAHYTCEPPACLPPLSSSLCSLLLLHYVNLLLSFSLHHLLALCLNVFISTWSLPHQFRHNLDNSLLHLIYACDHTGLPTSRPDLTIRNPIIISCLVRWGMEHDAIRGLQGSKVSQSWLGGSLGERFADINKYQTKILSTWMVKELSLHRVKKTPSSCLDWFPIRLAFTMLFMLPLVGRRK